MIANRQPFVATQELQRAAELLIKYPVLALPSAVASVVMVGIIFIGVLSAVATIVAGGAAGGHTGAGLGIGAGVLIGGTLFLAGLAVVYLGQAMVVAAAPYVLANQSPNLGMALRVTMSRLPAIATAALACFALSIVPIALCLVLIGIPLLLVLGYFLTFVPAAVVVGNEGGIQAIKTSFRLTTTRVNESLICWLGVMLATVAGMIVNAIGVHIPVVNLLLGFAVGGFTSAYAALLSTKFYLELRDAAPAAPTMTSWGPTTTASPSQASGVSATTISGPPTIPGS